MRSLVDTPSSIVHKQTKILIRQTILQFFTALKSTVYESSSTPNWHFCVQLLSKPSCVPLYFICSCYRIPYITPFLKWLVKCQNWRLVVISTWKQIICIYKLGDSPIVYVCQRFALLTFTLLTSHFGNFAIVYKFVWPQASIHWRIEKEDVEHPNTITHFPHWMTLLWQPILCRAVLLSFNPHIV